MPCICIVPAVEGIGGMASFRRKFEAGLTRRGIGYRSRSGRQLRCGAGHRRHASHPAPVAGPAPRCAHRAAPGRHQLDPQAPPHRRASFPARRVRQPDPVFHPLPAWPHTSCIRANSRAAGGMIGTEPGHSLPRSCTTAWTWTNISPAVRANALRIAVASWWWKATWAAATTWDWRTPCDLAGLLQVEHGLHDGNRGRGEGGRIAAPVHSRTRPCSRSLGGRGATPAHSRDRSLGARALFR